MGAIRDLAAWDFERPGITLPPSRPLPEPVWRPCAPASGADWECASERGVFRYRPDAPEQSRFAESVPALIVVAEASGLRELRPADAPDPEVGVVVDVPERRVLFGVPDLLRSTLVQLLYLDGRYARHLEKFDERAGYGGERVLTWRIRDEP
jgi:hypothetical protein